MYCDAHLHLHEIREGYPLGADVDIIFSCTAHPSEWDALKHIEYEGMKRFYGVHPWYCSEWSDETEDTLLALLKEDPSAGVGEIGLDGSRGSLPEQAPAFRKQLGIASSLGRTANVHMVDAEKETLDCIRECAGGIPIIIHSFKSESYVKPLSALGCYFSLNPRILSKKRESVRRIFDAIPGDRLLLESDAPHNPKGFSGMEGFISELADTVGMSADDLSDTVCRNLRSIS